MKESKERKSRRGRKRRNVGKNRRFKKRNNRSWLDERR